MKLLRFYFVLACMLVIVSCSKEDNKELPNKEPKDHSIETSIDGEMVDFVFNANVYYYPRCSTLEFAGYLNNNGYIYASAIIDGKGEYQFNTDMTYAEDCSNPPFSNIIYVPYLLRTRYEDQNEEIFYLNDSLNSILNVTLFDINNKIIEGNFEFTLFNDSLNESKFVSANFYLPFRTNDL